MGIYFRDILLVRISRGANNCDQYALGKNIYFIMWVPPHHFQLFHFNERLEFCEFFEWEIKKRNNADLFSQLPLLIFTKGANISGGHCINFRVDSVESIVKLLKSKNEYLIICICLLICMHIYNLILIFCLIVLNGENTYYVLLITNLINFTLKGIVHPKMKMWCLSAYPQGIQDVGDFVSSVEHKRRILTHIFELKKKT